MSIALECSPEITDNTCLVFCANVANSSVVFTLTDQNLGNQPGLAAAIALAKLQPEISFIEQLLSAKLTFDWINVRPQKSGFSLHGFSHTGERLLIDLPYSVVESFNNATDLKTPKGLHWQTLVGQMKLSALRLSVDDISKIEKSAMLLIPESFETYWNVKLLIGETAQKFEGHLDLGKFQFTFNSATYINCAEVPAQATSTEQLNDFEIHTNEQIAVSPEMFLGDQVLALPSTLLEQELQLIGAHGVKCHGVLSKIGNGYGLYVTQTKKQA